jgi:hypothetical protein
MPAPGRLIYLADVFVRPGGIEIGAAGGPPWVRSSGPVELVRSADRVGGSMIDPGASASPPTILSRRRVTAGSLVVNGAASVGVAPAYTST